MPDVSKISGIYFPRYAGGSGSDLVILYDRQWYLVPFEPGGWGKRQKLTPNRLSAEVGLERQLTGETAQSYWDIITANVLEDDELDDKTE
jgi:hypothetical protein